MHSAFHQFLLIKFSQLLKNSNWTLSNNNLIKNIGYQNNKAGRFYLILALTALNSFMIFLHLHFNTKIIFPNSSIHVSILFKNENICELTETISYVTALRLIQKVFVVPPTISYCYWKSCRAHIGRWWNASYKPLHFFVIFWKFLVI